LRTFDVATMNYISFVAKTLDRVLGNKPMVSNFKLEFSMGNLQHVSQSSWMCVSRVRLTSSSVQNGEDVEWAWYGMLEVFTVLTTRSEDKSQKCTLQSAAADINLWLVSRIANKDCICELCLMANSLGDAAEKSASTSHKWTTWS
jgi:hypothetical protein